MLTGDIFYVDRLPFLVTLSKNIHLMTAHYLKDRKPATIADAINQVRSIYKKHGFTIKRILMDGEFEPLCNDLNSSGINLNIASANEHVPEIEWQIRIIKE